MASFLERLQADASAFSVERKGSSGPPGGFSLGTGWIGGPSTTDAWRSKPAPSPVELIEHFKSIAYSCAVINANAVSSVPLKLYMDSTNGKKPKDISDPREVSLRQFCHMRNAGYVPSNGTNVANIREIREHPFLHTLNNPDPYGMFDLVYILKMISLYSDIIGRAYFAPKGPEGRPYTEFWPLFSQYVLPVRAAGTPIPSHYQYFASRLEPDEIVYFGHGVSLKDPYGASYPPLYAAYEYAKLEDKFVSVQEQLLAQGPRPNLIASPADANAMPGDAERLKFEQELNMKHARSRQGGILVTTGMWNFQPTTYAPTDLSGLKIAEYDWQAMCAAMGTPIEFFSTDTNLANLQAAKEMHAEQAISPRCMSIASKLTRVIQQWDRRLFFAFDNPLKVDREQETKIFDMDLRNGSITINQRNAETGLPPVPWGDEPILPNTMSPLSMIVKMNEATIKMATAGAIGMAEGGGNPAVNNKDVKKKPKAKGGDDKKKKPNASRNRSLEHGGTDGLRGAYGGLDQEDAELHGVEGLAEGEDRDPFDHLPWSVDLPSEASG
ncbi:MAG: phage portal protein [Candidatus Pacebacteria bacterium]|nr:phage portal protein [Candidatus Paceibacterota bacterium]